MEERRTSSSAMKMEIREGDEVILFRFLVVVINLVKERRKENLINKRNLNKILVWRE